MRTVTTAAAGSSLFFALAPSVVAGVVPWWLTGWDAEPASPLWRGLGAVLLATGAAVLVHAFAPILPGCLPGLTDDVVPTLRPIPIGRDASSTPTAPTWAARPADSDARFVMIRTAATGRPTLNRLSQRRSMASRAGIQTNTGFDMPAAGFARRRSRKNAER